MTECEYFAESKRFFHRILKIEKFSTTVSHYFEKMSGDVCVNLSQRLGTP